MAAGGAALALPGASPRRGRPSPPIVLRNRVAEWHVWPELRWTPDGRVVGPGYVGRVISTRGELLVDDVREPGTLSDPRYGGLGAFGWQHSRAGSDEWDVHLRVDARRNGGFGVSRSRVVRRATSDGVAVAVDLADRWQDPVMSVLYDYRVEPDALSCLIRVTQRWQDDGAGQAFVKEPKLAVAPLPLHEAVEVRALDGSLLRTVELARLSEPWEETAQLAEAGRAAVRFVGRRPLQVTMLAWDGAAALAWEGAPAGLDRWAQLAQQRPARGGEGAAYCLGGRGGLRRRWEVVKRTRIPANACLFHAWEGGTGLDDCPDASRAFGPAGEAYTVLARYEVPAAADV